MEVKSYSLKDPHQFHEFFRAYVPHPPTGWWFRGQANSDWSLLPKAGRPPYRLPKDRHLGRFRAWTKSAVAYDQHLPTNDWERLAIAQHYGLATCLLDWTYNPLVALYFCCCELPDSDGAVYCYDPDSFVKDSVLPLDEELQLNGCGFMPRSITSRILNQRAIFSVHTPPSQELEVKPSVVWQGHPNLAKLVVPAKFKDEILRTLDIYGVNHVGLFPDLEGLSKHINWETIGIASSGKDLA